MERLDSLIQCQDLGSGSDALHRHTGPGSKRAGQTARGFSAAIGEGAMALANQGAGIWRVCPRGCGLIPTWMLFPLKKSYHISIM